MNSDEQLPRLKRIGRLILAYPRLSSLLLLIGIFVFALVFHMPTYTRQRMHSVAGWNSVTIRTWERVHTNAFKCVLFNHEIHNIHLTGSGFRLLDSPFDPDQVFDFPGEDNCALVAADGKVKFINLPDNAFLPDEGDVPDRWYRFLGVPVFTLRTTPFRENVDTQFLKQAGIWDATIKPFVLGQN